MIADQDQTIRPWQRDIHAAFKAANIGHVSCVPDGGHQGLIKLCTDDQQIGTTVLTTEEEGVALAAGLMLGGTRSVLLMQSSGVGNCLNLFTLAENCRLPLVLLITMRGEFAEFAPGKSPWESARRRRSSSWDSMSSVRTMRDRWRPLLRRH